MAQQRLSNLFKELSDLGLASNGAEMTQDRLPIDVKGSPECRRGMLFKHLLSVSKGKMLNLWCTEVPNMATNRDSWRYGYAVFTFIFAPHH
jgi:hypothetical protein